MIVVNIILIVMICLVAADHPVIVIDSLIQEVIAMMGSVKAAGTKEVRTSVQLLYIFIADISLVIITHVGSLQSSSSKFITKRACDYHRESPLRRDSSYKCYSRKQLYSSRKRFSRPSNACYVCGRQDRYKKGLH